MVLSGSLDDASHTSSRQRRRSPTDCDSAAAPHRSRYLSRPKWGGLMARLSTMIILVHLTPPARRRGGRGLTVCLLLPHTGLAAFPSGASQSQSPLTHFCESTASAVCTLLSANHLGRRQPCLTCFALHPLYKITICIISHIFLVLDLVFHKMPTYLRHCLTSGADLISIQKGTSL